MKNNLENIIKLILEELKAEIKKPKRSSLFEDLFLKKDSKNNKLIIFSDYPDKKDRAKETYKLGPEFKKLGFTWDANLGHWVGDISNKNTINSLIKKT